MAIILNGTTGITTPDIDSTAGFDGEDLTGDVAAARITGALNATGSAPIYACRAWVNFNGTGTVAILASGNVSSITDDGVGKYRMNFTTAMPDANYSETISMTGNSESANTFSTNVGTSSPSRVPTAEYAVICTKFNGAAYDASLIMAAVFR